MRRTHLLVAVLAGLGAGCSGERSLRTADGRTRTFRVYAPRQRATPTPAVIALHGGGGSAEVAQDTVGLDRVADEAGFVAVYPNGIGKKVLGRLYATWNADPQCCGEALKAGVDDVAFISQLIDVLVKDERVDPKRVNVTGHSNGGVMAHRLGCELSGKIAAIAPTASPLVPPACAPGRPVPVMIVHGTADQCASYEDSAVCGGCFAQALEELGLGQVDAADTFTNCQGAVTQGAGWRARNGCGATARVSFERGAARCETYDQGCAADVTVCTVTGGGHALPGSTAACDERKASCQAYLRVAGPISQDLSVREIWGFFARHTLE